MKVNYDILLLGDLYSDHMVRFVRNLKQVNADIIIDGFQPSKKDKIIPTDYQTYFRELTIAEFSHYFNSIPGLRTTEIIANWRKHFHTFAKGKHYDIVNIHFPNYVLRYIINDVKRIADKIVVIPWGSDVYRVSNRKKKILKHVFDAADFVIARDRFAEDCQKLFVPSEKMIQGGMGSETIDFILDHKKDVSTDEAKRCLGIKDSYAISCGYNASPAQRHLRIIEAIGHIKKQLPENLILIFPVTYPPNKSYVDELKSAVREIGIKALFYDRYLDLEQLFMLRQATDMFIHVQTTDANNASLKEYLLLEKNCINGGWMTYPDLEKDGYKPFYVVETVDDMEEAILEAYTKGALLIKKETLLNIEKLGYRKSSQVVNNLFMSISK